MTRWRDWFVVCLTGLALTYVFWAPLWHGGGFVGGDIYSYFLPQKAFFADRLADGEFPFWNFRTGLGYPLIAESQTAAFYPFNLVLYSAFELNTAYSINHILHYVLAFVLTWSYCRRIRLTCAASLLAATIYVYGWFPARCSLEWAIIGGTWLPAGLWSVESFLLTRRWKYLGLLSAVLAVQMLAGHYSLAFITQLTILAYVPLRLRLLPAGLPTAIPRAQAHVVAAILISFAGGFALAAMQLAPTWELKSNSQRATVNREHDPGYGHIPPLYWTQVVASWWFWHSPDIDLDRALANMNWMALPSRTNKVEAHLYFGLVPLYYLLMGMIRRKRPPNAVQHWYRVWGVVGLAAFLYTSGCLIFLTRHLPGFSFFEGPGRYGCVVTFAVSILAAQSFSARTVQRPLLRHVRFAVVLSLTVLDLWVVGRTIAVAPMVNPPPIAALPNSRIGQRLVADRHVSRLFAPGPNLPTLLGVSMTPQYLGIGPAAYYDDRLTMPVTADTTAAAGGHQRHLTVAQLDWLRRHGVTHVLSFDTMATTDDSIALESTGPDVFLNAAWGRSRYDPLSLYRIRDARGRVFAVDHDAPVILTLQRLKANVVRIESHSESAARIVLADLFFPGWVVTVDGSPSPAIVHDGMLRAVDVPAGRHLIEWRYQPSSLRIGAAISFITLVCFIIIAWVRYRSSNARTELYDPLGQD